MILEVFSDLSDSMIVRFCDHWKTGAAPDVELGWRCMQVAQQLAGFAVLCRTRMAAWPGQGRH